MATEPTTPAGVELLLPFPPAALSPNSQESRSGWRAKEPHRAKYLLDVYNLAVSLRNRAPRGTYPLAVPTHVAITFVLLDRRRRDFDNLIAMLKPGIDGIVRARLLADDDVSSITLSYAVEYAKPAAVKVRLTPP